MADYGSLIESTVETLRPIIKDANDIVRQLNAVGNTQTLVAEYREDENTQDEVVKAFQEWLDKVDEARERKFAEVDAYIKANLLPPTETVDVEGLTAKYSTLAKDAKAMLKLLNDLGGKVAEDDTSLTLLTIKGRSTKGSSVGRGAGVKRPRVTEITFQPADQSAPAQRAFTTQTKDGVTIEVISFTSAAMWANKNLKANIDSSTLRDAAFSAAGTDDLSSLQGKAFSYSLNIGEAQKPYLVTVTPSIAPDKN